MPVVVLQRAGNGNLPHTQPGIVAAVPVHPVQPAANRRLDPVLEVFPDVFLGPVDLELPLTRQVEQLIAEGKPGQFDPASRPGLGEQDGFGRQRIEVFVDNMAAVDRRTVIQNQRRYFRQRVRRGQFVPLFVRDARSRFERVVKALFDRDDLDLVDQSLQGRVVELHVYTCLAVRGGAA